MCITQRKQYTYILTWNECSASDFQSLHLIPKSTSSSSRVKGRTLVTVVVVVNVVVFLTVVVRIVRRDGRAIIVVVIVFVVGFLMVYVIVGYEGLVWVVSSILMQQPRISRKMAKIRRLFKIIDIFLEIWYYWTLFISTIFAWFDYLKPWVFALDISYCCCLPPFVP